MIVLQYRMRRFKVTLKLVEVNASTTASLYRTSVSCIGRRLKSLPGTSTLVYTFLVASKIVFCSGPYSEAYGRAVLIYFHCCMHLIQIVEESSIIVLSEDINKSTDYTVRSHVTEKKLRSADIGV